MEFVWIKKNDNPYCIIFFNGWGMDKQVFSNQKLVNYDVCMFNNYINLELPLLNFPNYDKLYLVAWSMGVWAAGQAMLNTSLVFEKSVAINGTENPIHDQEGIPKSTFRSTLNNWNEHSRNKFHLRMIGGKTKLKEYINCMSNRTIESQKLELIALQNKILETSPPVRFKWSKVIIGTEDQIFPHENLLNYWKGKASFQEFKMPHFPFFSFDFLKILEII